MTTWSQVLMQRINLITFWLQCHIHTDTCAHSHTVRDLNSFEEYFEIKVSTCTKTHIDSDLNAKIQTQGLNRTPG